MRNLKAQMLDALELFYYSYRFRHLTFAVLFEDQKDFEALSTDLRVLGSSHIKVVVFCQQDHTLHSKVSQLKQRGAPYEFLELSSTCNPEKLVEEIAAIVEKGGVPVVGVPSFNLKTQTPIFEICSAIKVEKSFLISEHRGIEIDGIFYSHLTPGDHDRFGIESEVNIGWDSLEHIIESQQKFGFEIILLDNDPGSLFEEIFTHRGRGTLFTENYPNIIRKAEPKDIQDILLILRSYFEDGKIVLIDEESISKSIADFFVYTVNGAIVATTKLTDFGESAELAKFATLPRYQGKGRARELARHMIEVAWDQGKKQVFALSIEESMWRFFLQLGFKEIDRQELPEQWRKQYDFTRPSKAFIRYRD